MEMSLVAVYAPERLDVGGLQRRLKSCGDDEIVSGLRGDPLSVPWDIAADPREWTTGPTGSAPWHKDFDLRDAGSRFRRSLVSGLTPPEAMQTIRAADRARFSAAVRVAAQQWLRNLARLVHGEDGQFEFGHAVRQTVDPSGIVIWCADHLTSSEPTAATVHAEILLAIEEVFPELAASLGVFPLDRCRLIVEAPS